MTQPDTSVSEAAPPIPALDFFIDREPPPDDFFADAVAGLSQRQKSLPPKYFYDRRGSALFDEICALEEYYPTRTELALLADIGPELAAHAGPKRRVVEYGSGSSVKIRTLLDALSTPAEYTAIDISRAHLLNAATALAKAYPALRVGAICADFTDAALFQSQSTALTYEGAGLGQFLGFFPGSTIGNFDPHAAISFLRHARRQLGSDGQLLIGVDIKKDAGILKRAYNDARGVTAEFNKNILVRMKKELGADVDCAAFAHRAFYNEPRGRIEMHLQSLQNQSIFIGDHTFTFTQGETIHTENSYKYDSAGFSAAAAAAGWGRKAVWKDPQDLFSIFLLEAKS